MQDITSFEMIQLTKRCSQKTSKCVGSGGGGGVSEVKSIYSWKEKLYGKNSWMLRNPQNILAIAKKKLGKC